MHGGTSSAPGRAMGRGFKLVDVGPEPFHCVRGDAHRWGLINRVFAVVIDGHLVDEGQWLEERCKRCGSRRPLIRSVPE